MCLLLSGHHLDVDLALDEVLYEADLDVNLIDGSAMFACYPALAPDAAYRCECFSVVDACFLRVPSYPKAYLEPAVRLFL